MMHTYSNSQDEVTTQSLVRGGLITAVYIVLTMAVAPFAFGPVQFRISEALNFTGLYNKRYVWAITLGVMIVNFIQSTVLDVFVGGFHTLFSLLLARWIGEQMVLAFGSKVKDSMKIRYIVMTIVFSLTMFIIAWMLLYLGYEDYFWQTYGLLALSEFIVMTLGGFVMYYLITPRVDFNR